MTTYKISRHDVPNMCVIAEGQQECYGWIKFIIDLDAVPVVSVMHNE